MNVKQARKLLENRLAEISRSSAVLVAEGAEPGSGELSHVHSHRGDEGTDISDSQREVSVLDAQAADRALIERALERIDEGTYGRCIDCGSAIPNERLKARPEVSRCLQDQQKYEARLR